MALKAHNVSWYLGVSVFGGAEAVEVLGSDRCHFRVDVDVDVDVAGGVVMSQPALQPVVVVQSQPEPVIVIERPVVAAVQSPFLAHGAKVAFFNLGHMHFLGADFGGELSVHGNECQCVIVVVCIVGCMAVCIAKRFYSVWIKAAIKY